MCCAGFDATSKTAMKTAVISAAKINFELVGRFNKYTAWHLIYRKPFVELVM